jgi:hypothetical protein
MKPITEAPTREILAGLVERVTFLPALLGMLSADCPKRQSITAYDLCGVLPELSALFLARTG